MALGQRIKELRKGKNLRQKELADRIGVNKSTVCNWEYDINEPNPKQRAKLCNVLGISESDLFSGSIPSQGIIPKGYDKVPVLSHAPAGDKKWVDDEIEGWYNLPNEFTRGHKCYLLRIKGDSMTGANIQDGSLVIVDFEADPVNGNIVIAWIDGECTIKRFFKYGDTIVLKPENPKYPEMHFDKKNHIRIRGVVKGVLW